MKVAATLGKAVEQTLGQQGGRSAPAIRERGGQGFLEKLEALQSDWNKVGERSNAALGKLPSEVRSLVELQIDAGQLQVQTTVVSKVGETVGATMRRLQQMG